MRLFTIFLPGLLSGTCLALEAQFNHLKEKGQGRTTTIENTKVDNPDKIEEVLGKWDVENERVDLKQAGSGFLETLNTAGSLGLSSQVWDRYATYPKGVTDDNQDELQARFSIFYDPAGGAIINDNRLADPEKPPPIRSSEVAWSLYKQCCEVDQVDHTKLKTIMSLAVTAEFAPQLLNSIWDGVADKTRPHTMAAGSDEALAILGLDNAAATWAILAFHNQELGKKSISSVSLFPTEDNIFHLWWSLE